MSQYIIIYDLEKGNDLVANGDTRYKSLSDAIDKIDKKKCMLSQSSYLVQLKVTSRRSNFRR